MDIFSKQITDREEKHCGCGERGSHGAYTGNGYEDYRGYGDLNDYGSQAECRSCAIFNGLNESRSSCGCGSSNSHNESRVFEANRGCGSCSGETSRGSSCSCTTNRGCGSCSGETSRNSGSCSCETSRNSGSCSGGSSPSYSSCYGGSSPSYSSCSGDTSPCYSSCSSDTSPSCGGNTYEESGCCDTYKESRSCGSCSTYGNDNYSSCNPCAEYKSCDSGSGDSCGCTSQDCGVYVHCDSCGYYEPKGCDSYGSRNESSYNDVRSAYDDCGCGCQSESQSRGCGCQSESQSRGCGCQSESQSCGCGCQSEPQSCGCGSYDGCSEKNCCCNICSAPRGCCDCSSFSRTKGRGDSRKSSSDEFGLGFDSFAGFSPNLGIKCYQKKPKKCRKRGKICCRCKTDMTQKGICSIKKGLELSQKGYKEICSNSFYEGEQSICAAIDVIRCGLIDFNKGLADVKPCLSCDGWKTLYMGVCHIDAGLKELCKGNKELSKHCYDKCSTEEIKKGICSLEEGLKKFTKALINILY